LLTPTLPTDYSGTVPPDVSRGAVEHYIKSEWAVHLDDVMMRRSSWHYYHADSARVADQVASWMAELLAWSPAERQQEIAAYNLAGGWHANSSPDPLIR